MNEKASFDPEFEIVRITKFLRKHLDTSKSKGFVVGISGGIDSAVVASLCERAIGRERTTGVLLFEDYRRKSRDFEDASDLIRRLKIQSFDIRVTPVIEALERSLRAAGVGTSKIALANLRARARMVLLYYIANQKNYLVAGTGDKSEDLIGFFCYDEKTHVVTKEGPKGYRDLKKGDVVYSYDLATDQVVESIVDGVFVFDYEGDLINFKSQNADLMVTPNHRMLVRTSCGDMDKNKIRVRTAEECLTKKYTVIPFPTGWSGREENLPSSIELTFSQKRLERKIVLSIEDLFYIIGLFIGDGCAVKGAVTLPVVSKLTRQEYQTASRDRSGRFASLSMSTGTPIMKTYDTYETDFALPIPDKNEVRNRLTQLLRKYGIGFSSTRDLVRIPSKGIYDFFSQCGIGAKNKRIPKWILDYPSHYLAFLMRGLKDSDGGHSEIFEIYYTSSTQLKNDFVELCVKLGRLPSVRVSPPRIAHYNGKEIGSSGIYEITFSRGSRNSRWITNSRARKILYEGKVWCPSVPPHENILVERNGRYAFCGNTKYGDGGVDILPIAHLYKTQVRELGRALRVPDSMVSKPSSPNLWRGQKATDEIPADYDKLDPVLSLLFDQGLGPIEVSKKSGSPLSLVDDVIQRNLTSAHKRRYPPMVESW